MKDMVIYAIKIIGGIFLICLVFAVVLYFVMASSSKQLVCTSDEGDITIYYSKKGVLDYTADGMEFDLEGQREYSVKVGIDAYLDEFSEWFQNNTTGTCQ